MRQSVRRNEHRFYRYPQNRIAAILDDDQHLAHALQRLENAGVMPGQVNVLTGEEGARLLDSSGAGHGLRARLLRLLQRTAYEGAALDAHESALHKGQHVIYVPLGGGEDREEVIRALRASGGHFLLQFHRWSVEELRF